MKKLNDPQYISISEEKPQKGLERFQKEFLNDRITELEELSTFLLNGNSSSIKKIAHKWIGFCLPYGFNGLDKIAHELFKNANEENLEKCGDLISSAKDYLSLKKALVD